MLFRLPVKQLLQEMMTDKVSLLLTVFAVAWSALSIAMVLSIGEGLRQGVMRVSTSGNGNFIYLQGGRASINYGLIVEGDELKLQMSDLELMRSLPSVRIAEATGAINDQLSYNSKIIWHSPIAVSPEYAEMAGLVVTTGSRWINELDTQHKRKVLVLGWDAAITLFNNSSNPEDNSLQAFDVNPIGKIVNLGEDEYQVIGVLAPNKSTIEQGDVVDYVVFIPLATWLERNPTEPLASINIVPNPDVDRLKVAQSIQQVFARKYGASLYDDQFVSVTDKLLQQKSTRAFLLRLQSFLGLIGLVSLSVAGIGIANVMFVSVKRAERDIGIRMAIGATPNMIRLHYFMQALITMMIGGIIGLLVTLGLVELVSHIPLEENFIFTELGRPYPVLSVSVLLSVILALIVVGILAAWFPASKASSVMPLEVLQGE